MRVVTLKNAAWFVGGLLLIFIAFSLYNELRPPEASREQLYERGRDRAAQTPKRPAMIEEKPVSDDTFAIPQLIERPPPPPSTTARPRPTSRRRPTPTLKEADQSGERISITGGAEGLRVEVRSLDNQRPVLTTATESPVPPDRF